MNVQKDTDNALKKALQQRIGEGLPSNFTYKMMERVHVEVEKQRKRRKFFVVAAVVAAICVLVSLAAYVLIYYLDFNLMEYIPRQKMKKPDSALMDFYGYIGILVLILLGIDYWIRKHKRKSPE